jgi:hypothetical protein
MFPVNIKQEEERRASTEVERPVHVKIGPEKTRRPKNCT